MSLKLPTEVPAVFYFTLRADSGAAGVASLQECLFRPRPPPPQSSRQHRGCAQEAPWAADPRAN